MTDHANKFYVTTPIYYVTAKPHVGSLYSTLLADVVARWHKLQGTKVFFLTGTDEHGQKVAQAAEKAGKTPQEFVDSFIPAYRQAWKTYEIDYDLFIRTTDDYHTRGAQQLVEKLIASGDIYKDRYTGWYCVSCETFVTHKDINSSQIHEQQGPACPTCGRQTTMLSEETYFFRLSRYQDKLLALYKNNPHFIVPNERVHEVISFVEAGLKDLSISRTSISWGIPFPHDPAHIIYVWIDALSNYITAVGYGDPAKHDIFKLWWPADLHILGKDIIRFHAVYWPAFLMAAGLPLPKKLLVHGWIKVNQQKMSKSFGNVIDPLELQKTYGVEPVRYYLLRHIPVNQDGDFSTQDLERCIDADLANDLGNLLNRMVSLAEKSGVQEIDAPKIWSQKAMDMRDESWNTIEDVSNYINDCMFHLALACLWKFIKQVNGYFHEQEPWKLANTNRDQFNEVLSVTCHSLRVIAHLLWPIMPRKMEELLASLGTPFALNNDIIQILDKNNWHQRFVLTKIPALFMRVEQEPTLSVELTQQQVVPVTSYITIDDVNKVELVIGTIETADIVPQSDKLLKLSVNFGAQGKRQILAGIRKFYQPESLINKQALFVLNLKPRMMMGLESQGMMLLVEDETGNLQHMMPAAPVADGTRLR
jgi:methionyl-tRNA synthetase